MIPLQMIQVLLVPALQTLSTCCAHEARVSERGTRTLLTGVTLSEGSPGRAG